MLVCFSFLSHSQVGINTTTPEGTLDVNSTTGGIVFPRVALTARNVAAPIVNPNTGGAPVNGTYVFNTTTTNTGTNDVYPGLYVWYNNEWVAQFQKSDSKVFEQTDRGAEGLRTVNGINSIPGFVNETFTPKFSGTYKIEIIVNYGGGFAEDKPTSAQTSEVNPGSNHRHRHTYIGDEHNVVSQEGQFTFNFNGTNYNIYANSYSTYNAGQRYYAIWYQTSYIAYLDLVSGTDYNFNMFFNQFENVKIQNNGNSGDGRGFIGVHVPCYAEFNFISD
jgi:hypothetical protein